MKKNTSVIILGAGKGSRMKSSQSKVLHEIGGKPILLHVIDKCKKLKLDKICVILNKDSKEIEKILPKKIKIVIQEEQLGTAHAIMCAKNIFERYKGRLLVLYADVPLIEQNSLKKLLNNYNNTFNLIGFEATDPRGYGRIVTNKNKIIEIVEEKNADKKTKEIKFCNSGIFCGPSKLIFSMIKKIKINKNSKEYLLTDLFRFSFLNDEASNFIKVNEDEVLGINDQYQLAIAEKKYQNILRKKLLKKGVKIISPETVFFSFDTKVEAGVSIGAFCVFGKNVIVKARTKIENNCSISETTISEDVSLGPFCRLRNKNIIGRKAKIGNFVEIKNSRIGKNTKINHLAYIGDAIIGSNTNIGAGSITCNYDGKKKNTTRIGNNVFIGSNCSLIAPINIANNSFVAAGSTISKDLQNRDFSIARARQQIVRKGRDKFIKS